MNRFSFPAIFLLTALGLQAQSAQSGITISTSPSGARFAVDGQVYAQAATFLWPAGSKHIVVFITDPLLPGQAPTPCQTSPQHDTLFCLSSWADNLSLTVPNADPVQTITADPSVTSFTANLIVSYRVRLNFFAGPGSNVPPACGAPSAIPPGQFRPGIVFVGTQCFWASANIFVQAGTNVQLNAYPYPGFVFIGWTNSSSAPAAFLTSVVANSPLILEPHFSPAKRVTFLTSPLQLDVDIDHTIVPTRGNPSFCDTPEPVIPLTGFPPLCFGDFDFAPGSSHIIGGVSPQRDKTGNWWVFDHWSDGLKQNSIYTVGSNVSQPDTVTGTFVRGAQVGFLTTPTGLQLTIDGRTNWPSYDFVWGMNSTHQVAASASQFDAKGRQYTFQGWSNNGAASQNITVDQNAVNGGLRMTAMYNVLSRVVVNSTPPGLTLQVDGATCQTPCNIDRKSGAQLHVTAPATISMGAGARMDFGSWSDGGASDHTFTVNQDFTTLTASYRPMYQLTAASNPANGVTFRFAPSSSDMFYAGNTQVTVTATANPGFKFRRWDGALSGTYNVGVVSMAAPEGVVAEMDRVPYIAPAGVQNAASNTPSAAVAPGSIIAIFGQSLAPSLEVGPVNPLAQSIAGVSVTVNNMILPLLFVSPGQINAQLPSELPPGKYTMEIHSLDQPDVTGTFTAARNAPGLFSQTVSSHQYAVAFHEDGSLITPSSPAKGGETVSILGTGFGPCKGAMLDGFFPPVPPPSMADSVIVDIDGQHPNNPSATAAPGYTGLEQVKFQVPSGLSGSTAQVMVTINNVTSNAVQLPVE